MIYDVAPHGNGSITFEEFSQCMIETEDEPVPREDIQNAFAAFDRDESGYICPDDLQKMMRSVGEYISRQEAEDMIRDADVDADGKISYEEFEAVINSVGIKTTE
eukprot:SAG31_NODE_271_length_18717_cov_8.685949_10_plen_105_part_00